jgi:tetratricopeptide (TPR) repeat protein
MYYSQFYYVPGREKQVYEIIKSSLKLQIKKLDSAIKHYVKFLENDENWTKLVDLDENAIKHFNYGYTNLSMKLTRLGITIERKYKNNAPHYKVAKSILMERVEKIKMFFRGLLTGMNMFMYEMAGRCETNNEPCLRHINQIQIIIKNRLWALNETY